MKTPMKWQYCLAAIAAWVLVSSMSNGADADQKKPPAVLTAVSNKNEIIVHTGASLTIGLSQTLKDKIATADKQFKGVSKYQWRRNGKDLKETKERLVIDSVAHQDAGTYTVVVEGPVSEESEPVYVSVWNEEFGSNGGTLSIPVDLFTSSSGVTICGAGGFDRWKAYVFYGKNCTDQVAPFTNFAYVQLTVNTCCDINPTVDTAVRITDLDGGAPPPEVGCNNDGTCNPSHSNSKVSKLLQPITLNNSHHYRVVIWFKSGTLNGAENVGFKWLYRDP